jgi:hypothetical protein
MLYEVLAITDVAKPQKQPEQSTATGTATTGRILETDEPAGGDHHTSGSTTAPPPAKRCLKFVLRRKEAGDNPNAPLLGAFEVHPLPWSAQELLGATIDVADDVETSHNMLLLTPQNTRFGRTIATVLSSEMDQFSLDEHDITLQLQSAQNNDMAIDIR